MIEVDQDILGKQGRIIRKTADEFVTVKELSDGSAAVGLFNIGGAPKEISLALKDIGFSGKTKVRDLWRQKDLGTIEAVYSARVNPHGVAMIKISR